MALDALAGAIENLAKNVTSYALILAAVGTVTMALLELVKSLLDARMHFHRWRIKRWIPDRDTIAQLELLAQGSAEPRGMIRPLAGLATGEIQRADVLYDQPIDKLMGQVQAAANMALDFPWRYERLYRFLAVPPGAKDESDDAGRWLEYACVVSEGKTPPEKDARVATQARSRIGNLVARRLDAFQTEQLYLWAELNQRIAVLGGAVFLGCMLWTTTAPENRSFPLVVLISLLGGLVAPFAKDVVTALSGLSARAK
jgi:hypothetical protein